MPHANRPLGEPTPSMKHLQPIPVTLDEEEEEAPHRPSLCYKALSSSLPLLTTIQKYSSISFTVFSFIHGTTVLIAPSISISLSEELLSMGRSLYQAPYIEETLVFGSVALHVASGLVARLIRGWMYRQTHGEGKRRRRQRQRMTNSVEREVQGDVEVKDESRGLIGGVGGYLGQPKKSKILAMTGLTPLQFSGYLSVPLVGYHVAQLRLTPLKVDGDSSYVTMEYVTYFLNQKTGKALLNWVVYPVLILLTTYHTIYGMLHWLRVKKLQYRKLAMNGISLVSLWGMWSLYCVSKADISLPGFVTKRFDLYIGRL